MFDKISLSLARHKPVEFSLLLPKVIVNPQPFPYILTLKKFNQRPLVKKETKSVPLGFLATH